MTARAKRPHREKKSTAKKAQANTARAKKARKKKAGAKKTDEAAAPKQEADATSAGAAKASARKTSGAAARGQAGAARAPDRVVGLGASAGGLEAAGAVLAHLPTGSGLCIVLVTHLAAHRKSMLPELLSHDSTLSVAEIRDGMSLQADHVYVAPPGVLVGFREGRFALQPLPEGAGAIQVDHAFRAIAEAYGEAATGVVLSGSGSDGAIGLRQIKEHGGIAIAQRPESAVYDGMPLAAINTGIVDLVLIPEQVGPYLGGDRPPAADLADDVDTGNGTFERILKLLRQQTGVDFTAYKDATLRRRLTRRVAIRKATSLEDYCAILEKDRDEITHLGNDLIIQVTSFFRSPESFDLLASNVFPNILESCDEERPVRIWVPGCATGEEVYSIAISLIEQLPGPRFHPGQVQIFGTDVSETAISWARAGIYPPSISDHVSANRLDRFFQRLERGYRIATDVRESCVFARQDITQDPPFSRLDLIVCRNLLIYLRPAAQQRVLRVLHYALRPGGYLLLGDSETIGPLTDLFSSAHRASRLYRKLEDGAEPVPEANRQILRPYPVAALAAKDAPDSSAAEARRLMLERHATPALVVDAGNKVVETFGPVSEFLRVPSGAASLDLFKLVRNGLAVPLRRAIYDARNDASTIRREGIEVRGEKRSEVIDLTVVPLGNTQSAGALLVVFERPVPMSPKSRRRKTTAGKRDESRVRELEADLEASRTHMAAMIQDLEAANEELQSANEEILSSNEELQSTNEELDTAREELQSTNEEITTVNEELQSRNEELLRSNSDLENFIASVPAAIVIVARDLRIRRFTPSAQPLLNLLPSDIGRPLDHLRPNVAIPDLVERIEAVIRDVSGHEADLPQEDGRVLRIQIRPYADSGDHIEGAVVSILDVTQERHDEHSIASARRLTQAVADAIDGGCALLDADLHLKWVDRGFGALFRTSPEDLLERSVLDLQGETWKESAETLLAGFADMPAPMPRTAGTTLEDGTRLGLEARRLESDADQIAILLLARRPGNSRSGS